MAAKSPSDLDPVSLGCVAKTHQLVLRGQQPRFVDSEAKRAADPSLHTIVYYLCAAATPRPRRFSHVALLSEILLPSKPKHLT